MGLRIDERRQPLAMWDEVAETITRSRQDLAAAA
jgi:hypothetical protein